MRWLDLNQVPHLRPDLAQASQGRRIVRILNQDEKTWLLSELNGSRGNRWPNSLHRLAMNEAMGRGPAGPAGPSGPLRTYCIGLTDEVILFTFHLTGSVGLYYCTNGEVGAYQGFGVGMITDILGLAATINLAVYLGGPSLVGGWNINVGISGGELLVFGATVMFNPPPPPYHVIGYQASVGFGVGEMPIAAAIDASYAWTRALGTYSGGTFTPAPGLLGTPPARPGGSRPPSRP
jgi:hypothetical protein